MAAVLPKSVLITGANRGIGFELVKQFKKLTNGPEIIFATYRRKEDSANLFQLAQDGHNIRPIQLDVRDLKWHPKVVEEVASVVGNEGLNLLVNNAAISHKGQSLVEITHEKLMEEYEVNAVAPLMLTRAFLPLLKTAANGSHGQEWTVSRSAVVNVSSILGSIQSTPAGGVYAYRMSKSALNMSTKTLSADLQGDKILVVSIHPGWVKTDMGGPKAPLEVQQSGESILRTLMELKKNSNGNLISYDGTVLPF